MLRLISALCVTLFLACTQHPKPSAPAAAKVHGPEITQADGRRAADPNEALADFDSDLWRIYFDSNSADLKESEAAARVAQYLKARAVPILLVGNASTEGTNEYNLALGARRAETVKTYLIAAGIPANRITTKSLGEEAPVALEPDQEHLNRRVDAIPEAPQ